MKKTARNVQIIRAQANQAPTLTRIALESKAYWGYSKEWLDLWREELSLRPSDVVEFETYCATISGDIAGFYLLCCKDGAPWLEHLWILPKYIGQGIGSALFRHAIERVREAGYKQLSVESDPNAAGFYRRMGARQVQVRTVLTQGQKRELPTFVCDLNIHTMTV